MSRLSTLRQLDTSTPEATKESLARLVQELDTIVRDLEARPFALRGAGSPEGIRAAPVGSIYLDTEGGHNVTLYIKEGDGNSNTGWDAK